MTTRTECKVGILSGRVGIAVFFIFLASAMMAVAQLPTATVLGVVKDSSGTVVPEASVTTRNAENGQTPAATTAADGSFHLPAMPVGNYEIRVEHPGFQSTVRSGLSLTVGEEAVVNFTLEVGTVEQAVAVIAEAPLVNTTSGSLGGLVDEQRMADLPLNGRNFVDLTFCSQECNATRAAKRAARSCAETGSAAMAPPEDPTTSCWTVR